MNIQEAINQKTKSKLYVSLSSKPGLVGTQFYERLFDYYTINAEYRACYCENIEEDLKLVREHCAGASISMPFKNTAKQFVDEVKLAGPINTIKVVDKRLIGYNCDLMGIKDRLGDSINGKIVNLLGDGAMADNFKLLCEGRATVHQYSRKLNNWDERYSFCDILINSTPLGMNPTESPLHSVKGADIIVDCVIGDTELIKTAKRSFIKYITGKDLYINQLYHQFKIYSGIDPEPELIYNMSQEIFK